jgi:hypothetical protein
VESKSWSATILAWCDVLVVFFHSIDRQVLSIVYDSELRYSCFGPDESGSTTEEYTTEGYVSMQIVLELV